jgi:hypothetical protein
MRHMACGLLLLLLMVLGQAETGLILACERSAQAGHTRCSPQHSEEEQGGSEQSRAPDHDPQERGTSHDGPSCDAMASCGASAALPAGASVGLRTAQAVATPVTRLLPPPSRADAPGNPPPRA